MATQMYGWNVHVWDLTFPQMETGRKVSLTYYPDIVDLVLIALGFNGWPDPLRARF